MKRLYGRLTGFVECRPRAPHASFVCSATSPAGENGGVAVRPIGGIFFFLSGERRPAGIRRRRNSRSSDGNMRTLYKIAIENLSPGVRIANVLFPDPDFSGPFLLLKTQEDLKRIRALGLKECWVVREGAEASEKNPVPPKAASGAPPKTASPRTSADAPQTAAPTSPSAQGGPAQSAISVEQELVSLKGFYQKSFLAARELFLQTQETGEVQVEAVTEVVDDIVGSVQRNRDALLCLKGLQRADLYTLCHSVNVSMLAVMFGKFLGYDQEQLRLLGLAGILHDIGKQFIPASILNAPRRLNPDEFAIIRTHSTLGYEKLAEHKDVPELVRRGVLEHHEKIDGTGYPHGKSGEDISVFSSILSLADVYDALSSNKPYRKALPPTTAITTLYEMRGSAFPPDLTEKFIRCIGVYPTGSLVRLSTGEFGVVCGNPHETLNKPRVLAIPRDAGRFLFTQARMLDLEKTPGVSIRAHLNPTDYKFDCQKVLKMWGTRGS